MYMRGFVHIPRYIFIRTCTGVCFYALIYIYRYATGIGMPYGNKENVNLNKENFRSRLVKCTTSNWLSDLMMLLER